jgi:hypothetical protein
LLSDDLRLDHDARGLRFKKLKRSSPALNLPLAYPNVLDACPRVIAPGDPSGRVFSLWLIIDDT